MRAQRNDDLEQQEPFGTVQFSDLRHDDLVSYEYQKHCLFWALLHEIGYMTNSIPTYFNVGAFEIFRKICDLDFGMEHAALLRALQFIETVETGGLEFYGVYNTKTDGAARALRERYLQHKAKRTPLGNLGLLRGDDERGASLCRKRGTKGIGDTNGQSFCRALEDVNQSKAVEGSC